MDERRARAALEICRGATTEQLEELVKSSKNEPIGILVLLMNVYNNAKEALGG